MIWKKEPGALVAVDAAGTAFEIVESVGNLGCELIVKKAGNRIGRWAGWHSTKAVAKNVAEARATA